MRVAAGLAKDGFKKGDCLAIFSPNSIDFPIIYFAGVILGGTVTTWNPTYTAGSEDTIKMLLIKLKLAPTPSLISMFATYDDN